jgi:hypothetical protein
MDTITFIRQAVTQAHERLMASLEGLTEADVTWRPVANANTILEIAWHVACVDAYRRYRIVDEHDIADALARTQANLREAPRATVTPLRRAAEIQG